MFTRPAWLNPSSKKFRWTFLIVLIILVIGIGAILNAFVALPHPFSASAQPTDPAWLCQHAAETVNPVQAENDCSGTTNWRPDRPTGPEHAIEGFTAPVSVQAGETVKLYVSTTASAYTFAIYRMGWYNGLGGRLVYSSTQLSGIQQPAPMIDPATRMVSCSNWNPQTTLSIPKNWVSGVYIVKLLAGGYMRYTSFVVRNDQSHAAILFQTSVLTYEAYNTWGGYSLYSGVSTPGEAPSLNRSYVVSFDRPNDRGDGLGDFPIYDEYNMLRWLERSGYDVTYSTDIDTDQRPATLLQHRLFLIAGHDEYWSTAMRDNVTTARNNGVSLAFFGGNDVYWHVRLQNSPLGADREVVCYKIGYYAHDPAVDPLAASHPSEATVLWRAAPLRQPENALMGEMYIDHVAPSSLVLTNAAQPLFGDTSLHAGSQVAGVVGGEYDHIYQNGATPAHLITLAASPVRCITSSTCPKNSDTADSTLYQAPSGAKVFDAGTFYWGWGLDNDSFDPATPLPTPVTPAFQQFTANLLAYMMK
ncbi:MAG: N,N-dimethylformamidase beta subunit family domain-containing protein [Ktedonobacteraceae bacterium]